VVVVVIGGRAHSLSDVTPLANALVLAWLPGEEGGNALADVLCGDVDASGRLPVTLLRAVGQVGVHSGAHQGGGRSMILDDYVDTPASPLFPFGHGLSYTTWTRSDLAVDAATTGDEIAVAVTVTNTGDRAGTDVVQVYFRDDVASVGLPASRLLGFQRVECAPGVSTRLTFRVSAGRLGFAWSPVPLPSSSENSARRSPCPALSAFPIATHSRPSGVTSRLGELQLSIPGKARRCWSITLGSEDSHGGCRPRCDYCLCRPAFRTRKRLL